MTDLPKKSSPEFIVSPNQSSRACRPWIKLILIGATLLLVGYAVLVRPFLKPAPPARGGYGAGAVPVSAEAAHAADLKVRIVSLGTVTPVYTVTVRSRVDGELRQIFFEEGKNVEAGAPLAEIDPRPFEVQKLQTEAQLAKDNALLQRIERLQSD